MKPPRRPYDIECLPDYFLIKALDIATDRFIEYEAYPGKSLDLIGVRMLLGMSTIVTFNGNHYDVPMTAAALMGYDTATLKHLSDTIIKGGMRAWEFYRQFNIPEIQNLNHIDLFEVAPGVHIGLKLYMGRMHSKLMAECPIPFDRPVLPHQRPIVREYCANDLRGTADLLRECEERLELREFIGAEYGIECMSKSDAQMGEAMIKSQLPFTPRAPHIPHGHTFKYIAPPWIGFASTQLNNILAMVQRVDFVVNDTDQITDEFDENGDLIKTGILMPDELKSLVIPIGTSLYKMGIGGLHSQESKVNYHTIMGKHTVTLPDVASYYPSLILLMDMYPEACGPEFLPIYRRGYDARLVAKAKKEKVKANGLKIGLNGPYGKLNSKYSFLFAPQLMIRTTISGQLAILMLIEQLELCGIPVVSANTDGVVALTPCGLEGARDNIMNWWQKQTGLQLETTFYKSIYCRDVNNYVAFEMNGKHKGVGIFKASGIENNKHPENDIVAESVIAFLGKGVAIEKTVHGCTDIRKFIKIRKVNGGACRARHRDITGWSDAQLLSTAGVSDTGENGKWLLPNDKLANYRPALTYARNLLTTKPIMGEHVGAAIRWYRGTATGTALAYVKSGNKVPDSDQAVPVLELPDTLPTDVDHQYYIDEAYKLLTNLGL